MPHCYETNELQVWKQKVKKVKKIIGHTEYITFDKKKNLGLEWTVEELVPNKNTHDEDTSIMPIYDYCTMDLYVVNPLKKIGSFSPRRNDKVCK